MSLVKILEARSPRNLIGAILVYPERVRSKKVVRHCCDLQNKNAKIAAHMVVQITAKKSDK